ncbi:UPF0149 family protein [Alkalisalibacterium limincola]|uniref:UPF0149 family protein n=1 Tax=Alkalisalibacterium limincola TaxID=2699169 RepID=UPI002103CCCC|nr:UPF0149 family protein [Alkalisalibacterium limincola]
MSDVHGQIQDLPAHEAVAEDVRRKGLGVDASELHGLLAGYVCGGGQVTGSDWLGTVMLDEQAPRPAEGEALDTVFKATTGQLADADFGFALLLPHESQSLEQRAAGLLGWCRGFLGGFGLAAGAKPPLSEESAEALEDLGKIAGSQLSYDDPEGDEQALEEVAEFVRVAALLLHGDCVLGPARRRRLH